MTVIKRTKIAGGYGRTGLVLKVTFPARIARGLDILRGDTVQWKLHGNEAVVTLVSRGEHGNNNVRPKPVARRKEAIDYLLESMEEQDEETITPTEEIL